MTLDEFWQTTIQGLKSGLILRFVYVLFNRSDKNLHKEFLFPNLNMVVKVFSLLIFFCLIFVNIMVIKKSYCRDMSTTCCLLERI